ncbi:unnamed protein product [Linum trigynum]|uniref:KIB1-4 beta-propeller domain-containing protein n=1 Tax=Linum trigynum TaxID=586398 RepID=A0AAV2F0H2_9ROSI
MITGEDQRPWADICPNLLDSIYTRLPSHVDGTYFGGVCKNWYQVHSHSAVSNPLPMVISHTKFSSSDIAQVREDNWMSVQLRQIPQWLVDVDIKILGRAGAWLLIQEYGTSLGCYNPLLRSPANYIGLPNPRWLFSNYRLNLRETSPATVKVAFSTLPTTRDCMILMVYGDSYLSTVRCSDDWIWKTYDFSLSGKSGQSCLGLGYKKERFFWLFEMGDMLIFSVHHSEPRMLLAATKPLLSQQLERWDTLRVVAVMEKMDEATAADDLLLVVTHWERDHEASVKDSFRLVEVEEKFTATQGRS